MTYTVDRINIDLGTRSYDVCIGCGLIDHAGEYIRPLMHHHARRVAVLTDHTVEKFHMDSLRAGLGDIDATIHALTPGEATKGWAGLQESVDWLLSQRVERRDIVIAFGGGVIGDLAGFCAAIMRRGVRFVQIPTTLLAQVDSSVGGKTGINSRHGKNLVGAFHQPSLVLADITLLDTLPKRDFLAGYGEVVKYGLLGDSTFFHWLEKHGPELRAGNKNLRQYAVCQRSGTAPSQRCRTGVLFHQQTH